MLCYPPPPGVLDDKLDSCESCPGSESCPESESCSGAESECCPVDIIVNRIDGLAVALEMILMWINREAQNKHFKDLI